MENYDGFERDLKRIVGNCKVVRRPEGFVIQIECSKCHEHFDVLSKNKMPPDAINRKLAGQGWKTGHRMICPKHNIREKMSVSKSLSTGFGRQLEADMIERPVDLARDGLAKVAVEPTQAAKRVHRAVMKPEQGPTRAASSGFPYAHRTIEQIALEQYRADPNNK